jgi:hypothetical protein
MSHTDALAAGAAAAQPPASVGAGAIVGAAIGGALFIVAVIGVAIRYKLVSAKLNAPTVSTWQPGKKKPKLRVPDMDINLNHSVMMNPAVRVQKMKESAPPEV